MKKQIQKRLAQIGAGVAGVVGFGLANAAVDTTAVQTAITGAQSTGETVGGYVVAAVAGLVVIGVIIGIVKKL